MKYLISSILCALLIISGSTSDALEPTIGIVKTVEGSVSILRDDMVLSAKKGFKIYENDTLKTGPDGAIGVIFKDNTVLSLGPESQLLISEFLFEPAEGDLKFITKLIKGTIVYLSGTIAKLSPGSARLETPSASLGIRGTKFAVKVKDEEK